MQALLKKIKIGYIVIKKKWRKIKYFLSDNYQ